MSDEITSEASVESTSTTESMPVEDASPATNPPVTPPPAPSPGVDYDKLTQSQARALAQTLPEALRPLLPKAIEPPKEWDDDARVMEAANRPKEFMGLVSKLAQHQIDQAINPIREQLQQLMNAVPAIFASRAENPRFNDIQQRANEMVQGYGIPWNIALRMAADQISKEPMKSNIKTNPPPNFASSPDTSPGPKGTKHDKGIPEFNLDLIRQVRAELGNEK